MEELEVAVNFAIKGLSKVIPKGIEKAVKDHYLIYALEWDNNKITYHVDYTRQMPTTAEDYLQVIKNSVAEDSLGIKHEKYPYKK